MSCCVTPPSTTILNTHPVQPSKPHIYICMPLVCLLISDQWRGLLHLHPLHFLLVILMMALCGTTHVPETTLPSCSHVNQHESLRIVRSQLQIPSLMCSQIWLGPLVNDHEPTYLTKVRVEKP